MFLNVYSDIDIVTGDVAPVVKDELTLLEAAVELHVSEKTVRGMCHRGDLEHFRVGSRGRNRKGKIFITRASIEAYKRKRTEEAKPEPEKPQRQPIKRTLRYRQLDPNWKPK